MERRRRGEKAGMMEWWLRAAEPVLKDLVSIGLLILFQELGGVENLYPAVRF